MELRGEIRSISYRGRAERGVGKADPSDEMMKPVKEVKEVK